MSIALSLICPVYKVADFIPDLMNSLLAGVNSSSVEVIFVDDCCPDNSIAICEQFLSDHLDNILFKAVVLKQATNQGQAVARNAALKIAEGEYIGFVDSDDAIAPHYWQTLAKYVEQADNDIIEFSFAEFAQNVPVVTDTSGVELRSSQLNPFYSGFFVWTRLYNKAVVTNLSFPAGMIYEDIYFNIHAFAKAKTSLRLSHTLLFYRKRKGSTTNGRTSSYASLLHNMTSAIAATLSSFKQQDIVMLQAARYALLVTLKGFTITERNDRKVFFKECHGIISLFRPLFNEFNKSNISALKLRVSSMICVFGGKL
ncbi:MAG: glycosyltransferase involved in cell wall biosynthesis [Psychroserpens sp.]|jgi:glycosyltransferase involved in cell wall biosynthesis